MIYEEPIEPPAGTIARGGRTGFMENFRAAVNDMVSNNTTFSGEASLNDAYQRRAQTVLELTGQDLTRLPDEINFSRKYPSISGLANFRNEQAQYQRWFEDEFTKLKRSRPDVADQLPSYDDMIRDMQGEAARIENTFNDLQSRSGTAGKIAGFGGSVVGAFVDPINIGTLPIGGPSKTIAGAALKGAAINAGVETALQPFVQAGRDDLGLESGFDQARQNILAAGVGGGALSAAGKGLSNSALFLRDRLAKQRISDEAAEAGSFVEDFATEQLSAEVDIDALKPEGVSLAAHREALRRVSDDVQIDDVDGGASQGQLDPDVKADVAEVTPVRTSGDSPAIRSDYAKIEGDDIAPSVAQSRVGERTAADYVDDFDVGGLASRQSQIAALERDLGVTANDIDVSQETATVRSQKSTAGSSQKNEGDLSQEKRQVPSQIARPALIPVDEAGALRAIDVDRVIAEDKTAIERLRGCVV